MQRSTREEIAVIAVVVASLTLLSANSAASQAAPRDTTPAAVVRTYLAAYNAHDIDGVLAVLDSGFVWLSVVADSVRVEARGSAAIRAQLASYFRSLPSARSELEALTVLGPWVSARERAHWIGADGSRSQAALSVYEVRGGLLRRVWYYPSER